MNSYEMIQFSKALPIKLFAHGVDIVPSHWHDQIEILFVLDGSIKVTANNYSHILSEEDIFIIHPNSLHSVASISSNYILAIQLQREFLQDCFGTKDHIQFEPLPEDKNHPVKLNLCRNISELFFVYEKEEKGYEIKVKSIVYQMLYLLYQNNFIKIIEDPNNNANKYQTRIQEIMNYIKLNYKEDITLKSVADSQYLSPQYFSAFFKNHFGMNFIECLNLIRLENAVKQMENLTYSLSDIAGNSGFKNIQSFIKNFKEQYGETPYKYRKRLIDNRLQAENNKRLISYLDFKQSNSYRVLQKYYATNPLQVRPMEQYDETVCINTVSPGEAKAYDRKWKKITAVSKLKEVLYGQTQQQLCLAQREIGFELLRFHGLFDDDLFVYNEDADGNAKYSFVLIDKAIDFMLSIGLKPFPEIGFMPLGLAANPEKTHFLRKSILSKPKSMELWLELIREFFGHVLQRYGEDVINNWKFELWNEPDIVTRYWQYPREEYFEFYKRTFQEIKKIDSRLQLAAPGIVVGSVAGDEFLSEFLRYSKANDCLPDMITVHSYPLEAFVEKQNIITEISASENYLYSSIEGAKEILRKEGAQEIPIIVSEFCSSPCHGDFTHDTCYMSAYLAKNLSNNFEGVGGLIYWLLSDFHEENVIPEREFHGGMGLITVNGIKKPSFYALSLLSKIEGVLIARDKGYMVVQNSRGITVLLYNYCHLTEGYRRGYNGNIDYDHREEVFHNPKCIRFTGKFEGIKPGIYQESVYEINKSHGSPFDLFHMSLQEPFGPCDVEYINQKSQPLLSRSKIRLSDTYSIEAVLQSSEVRLIQLEFYSMVR